MAFALCVSGATGVFGQVSFELGLKAGVGLTKLSGDDTKASSIIIEDPEFSLNLQGDLGDSKLGFVVGGYGAVHVTHQFGVRLEALYLRKGGKGDVSVEADIPGFGVINFDAEVTATLDYIELPLLAVVSFPAGPSGSFEVFAGPALAFKTKAEIEVEVTTLGQTEKEDIGDETKGTDFGGVIGAGFVFELARVDLFADVRYTYGFTKILDIAEDFDIKNSAFGLMVGVALPLPMN
ncbi:MAG: PorT family protein [Candidatus Latescibacterota bacterium]|nr:MAG: PorT family protein [Candidatus Latescibacterota bacterium]